MHPLLIAILLFLTLGSTGYAKETISDSSADHALSKDVTSGLSRTKRGNFNFRRWNRGLQMLRLGKRDRADVFDDNEDNDHKPFYYERDLYGLVDRDLGKSNLPTNDGYLLTPSADGDFSKRSLAMLRLGKRLSNDETTVDKRTLNMLRLGKRQLAMLRLGKRGADINERSMAQLRLGKRLSDLSDVGADADSSLYDEKRNLNMLRLGKRQMQILRLGKREGDAATDSDLGDLPLRLGDVLDGESHISRGRLGKRNMQMLRLGKRGDDAADTASDLGPLRLGDMYTSKRTLNMLRLGKRDSDNQSTDTM